MSDEIEWHGDEAIDMVRKRAIQMLTRAAIIVARHAKELLSVAGTGKVKGKRVGPIERSKPGEPPRKQTGFLRNHVTYEVDESALEARVGTNLEYGKALELGTKRGLKPRPWLRRALAEKQAEINQLFESSDSGDA